jgi:hypothetical protein
LEVTVLGASTDIAVYTNAVLVDNTPLTADSVYGGGTIVVDHDYGGPDSLTITDPNGAGVQNADIVAYLQSDYDSGQRGSSFIRGRSTTDVNGQWKNPMMLEPELYKLLVSKTGSYTPETIPLEVLEETP